MLIYYVYAYLRTQELTPYYIGKGSGNRYKEYHGGHITVPTDPKRIVFMEKNLTELGALALERRYIRWYGRQNNFTGILKNLTDGGEGASGAIVNEETRKKMSKSQKNRPPETEETKRKKSISASGVNNSQYGKPVSAETKMKLSIANSGKKKYDCTNESRRKMSIAKTGINHPNYGKSSGNKGKRYKFITNEIESRMIGLDVDIPEGWRKGKSLKTDILEGDYNVT